MARDLSFSGPRGAVRGWAGGLVALSVPLLLLSLAVGESFRPGRSATDLDTSFLAAVVFLVAAPTAWVFAIDVIDVSRFAVLATGALTSLPLWWLLGARLAGSVRTWREWSARYVGVVLGWATLNVVVLAVIAAILV